MPCFDPPSSASQRAATCVLAALVLVGSVACEAFAEPPPNVDDMVVRVLVWDLATPLAQNQGESCSTVSGQGTSSSSTGSRSDDLWTVETSGNSRFRLEVGSQDESLAKRNYGAGFVASLGRDVFTVQTHAGRRVRLFVVASDNCSEPFPADFFDGGTVPTAPAAP